MAGYRLSKAQSQIEASLTYNRTSSAAWEPRSFQLEASHPRSTYKYNQRTGAPNEGEWNQNTNRIIPEKRRRRATPPTNIDRDPYHRISPSEKNLSSSPSSGQFAPRGSITGKPLLTVAITALVRSITTWLLSMVTWVGPLERATLLAREGGQEIATCGSPSLPEIHSRAELRVRAAPVPVPRPPLVSRRSPDDSK